MISKAIRGWSRKHELRWSGRAAATALLVFVLIVVYLEAFGLPWRDTLFNAPGPTRMEAATVLRVVKGFRGKYGGSFTIQVRLDSGREAEIVLPELQTPGARLRLTYSEGRGRLLNVVAFQPCQGDCR